MPPASVGRQSNWAASGEQSNNREIARSGSSAASTLLSRPELGQGQDHVWRTSGTLVRGMKFDRKWGRAHRVKDKRATAGIRRSRGGGLGRAGTQTARQWRREEWVFATWRV